MDFEYLFRCLYYLAKFIAAVPEACQALGKGWTFFKEFLANLDGYDNVETTSPICGDVTVPLMGQSIISATGRLLFSPPPAGVNVCDTVHMGIIGGYSTLQHQRNISPYYYT